MKRATSFVLSLFLLAGVAHAQQQQQGEPPAQPPAAQAGTLQADFDAITAAEQEIRRTPPNNPQRRALIEDFAAKCSAFIDAHGAQASEEQLGKAVGNWIGITQGKGAEGAAQVMARLPALKQLRLPAQLQKQITGIEAAANIKPGNMAPAWSATDIHDGSTVTLESLRGKLVLVDFWATWCGPCVGLMQRELAPLQARYGSNEGFLLVGLGMPWRGETAEKEVAFGNERGFHWKKVFDPTGDAATSYGVNGIPFLVLVDIDGKILAAGNGGAVIGEVKRILAERLGPGVDPAAAPATPATPPAGGH